MITQFIITYHSLFYFTWGNVSGVCQVALQPVNVGSEACVYVSSPPPPPPSPAMSPRPAARLSGLFTLIGHSVMEQEFQRS